MGCGPSQPDYAYNQPRQPFQPPPATDPNDPALHQPLQVRCGQCSSLLQLQYWSQYAVCPKCQSTIEVPRPPSILAQQQHQMQMQQQQMYQQQPYGYNNGYNNGYGGGMGGSSGMGTGMAIGGGLLGGLLIGEMLGGGL